MKVSSRTWLILAGVVFVALFAVMIALARLYAPAAAPVTNPVPVAKTVLNGKPRPAPIVPNTGLRQETEFTFTFYGPNPKLLAAGLQSKLEALLKPQPIPTIRPEGVTELKLPRTRYLDFVHLAEQHAGLNVTTRSFQTTTPSDSPVPIRVRFELAAR